MSSSQRFNQSPTMATSSSPPLNETNTESQPHSPPENSSIEAFKSLLNNDPIPNFDIYAIPPAVPEMKIDVAQRVEELHKYLDENKYPAHQKNIIAVIAMYNRKELPKPDTNAVWIQDGKLIELTVDCLLRNKPVWTEVCLRHNRLEYV
jgi:hypothetical protein